MSRAHSSSLTTLLPGIILDGESETRSHLAIVVTPRGIWHARTAPQAEVWVQRPACRSTCVGASFSSGSVRQAG